MPVTKEQSAQFEAKLKNFEVHFCRGRKNRDSGRWEFGPAHDAYFYTEAGEMFFLCQSAGRATPLNITTPEGREQAMELLQLKVYPTYRKRNRAWEARYWKGRTEYMHHGSTPAEAITAAWNAAAEADNASNQ